MNRFTVLAAAAALVAFSVPGLAADKAKSKEGRHCTTETVVGSHLPKRVCTTAAEREALRQAAQEKMANLHRQSRIGGTRSGAN